MICLKIIGKIHSENNASLDVEIKSKILKKKKKKQDPQVVGPRMWPRASAVLLVLMKMQNQKALPPIRFPCDVMYTDH